MITYKYVLKSLATPSKLNTENWGTDTEPFCVIVCELFAASVGCEEPYVGTYWSI